MVRELEGTFFILPSIDYHNKWIVSSLCAALLTHTHSDSFSMCGRLVNITSDDYTMMMRYALGHSVGRTKKALFDIHCSNTDRHVSNV